MFSWLTLDLQPNTIMVSATTLPSSLPSLQHVNCQCFHSGTRLKDVVGSPLYIAPSVLQKDYGTEADLWSLGIVLHVLLYGCPPFVGKNDKDTFQKIMNDPLEFKHSSFNDVSTEAKHLMSRLLTRNLEDKSMTASDVLGDVMCICQLSIICDVNCFSPWKSF